MLRVVGGFLEDFLYISSPFLGSKRKTHQHLPLCFLSRKTDGPFSAKLCRMALCVVL